MSFNVNSRYGELMNSAKWNERFKSIVGSNSVLAGLELVEKNGEAIVLPGKCIIAGAEIENTSEYTLDLSSYRNQQIDLVVTMIYIHNPTRVEFSVVPATQELAGNQIGLSTFSYNNGVISEIENRDKVLSLSELLTYIKENPGDKIFQTIQERDEFPEKKLYIGFSCFVIETMVSYVYKGNGVWARESTNAVHIGGEAPSDISMLWVDDKDEDFDASMDSTMLAQIRIAMQDMYKKISKVEYALTKELDAGYFGDKMPGEDEGTEEEVPTIKSISFSNKSSRKVMDIYPEIPAVDPQYPPLEEGEIPDPPNIDNGAAGTVESIVLKRGYKKDLQAPNVRLMEGELGFCIDTEELYVGVKGFKKLLAKVGGSSGGGNVNVTAEYIELIADNKKKYRIKVTNSGQIYCYDAAADNESLKPNENDAPKYAGLIINHVYGGGLRDTNLTPCSHGFIELYNTTDKPINLMGLYLQYGEKGLDWQVLPLRGIINPLCSFLVRCAEHTDIHRKTTKFKISNYDMEWDIPLTDKGIKAYLGVNKDPLKVPNPANIDGQWTKQLGYIDLFAYGSENPAFSLDAYEKGKEGDGYLRIASMFKSAHRKDFVDTDSSFFDIEAIDLRTADPEIYYPRYSGDGQWINYYNKLKLFDHKPNMVNICFGQDGNTTRTFTWQTTPTINGFLKYRKIGESKYKTVESTKQEVSHYDTNAIIHRVILRELTPGNYEYYVGEEGKWSDVYEFEVKVPTSSDVVKFIHTSDQQGINEEEYIVWKKAHNEIKKDHQYDFHINTGDISNDGGEFAFQWRYYYNFANEELSSIPHMTCCGNNDLTRDFAGDGKKRDPEAFAWYSTTENNFMVSCHSWNYGDIHFVCLNSNTLIDSKIADKQVPWLRQDLAKPENKKRWTIVYMHEAPYTIIKQAAMAPFIDVFAEFGVDLVLCGHHHRYSRSHRMGTQGPNGEDIISDTGFYTIMCQATGYKLMGKTAPAANDKAPWRAKWDVVGNPTYSVYEVTNEKIIMKTYAIANILPETDTVENSPETSLIDSLEITKPL